MRYDHTKERSIYRYNFDSKEGIAVNPFINLESNTFAIGGGVVWANESIPTSGGVTNQYLPSFYLRFGDVNKVYLDISVLHEFPLVSGNYGNIGLGSGYNPNIEWWLGIGVLPYEKLGFKGNAFVRLYDPLALHLFARYGQNEGLPEGAFGVGLRYQY